MKKKETLPICRTFNRKEQPVEEKKKPYSVCRNFTEKEQPVEEIKETPTQSAEPSTEEEQPVEETKETLLSLQNLQQKKNNL